MFSRKNKKSQSLYFNKRSSGDLLFLPCKFFFNKTGSLLFVVKPVSEVILFTKSSTQIYHDEST